MRTAQDFILSDELLHLALAQAPRAGAAEELSEEIFHLVERTPQRRRPLLVWPWTPIFPTMGAGSGSRWRSTWALVILALLVALALAIAGIVASRPHLPPFGLARTGLLAFRDGNNIVLINADGSGRRAIGDGGRVEWEPTWSRDGTRLAFWSRSPQDERVAEQAVPYGNPPEGRADLVVVSADGRNATTVAAAVRVRGPPPHGYPYQWNGSASTISWSTDGGEIAFEFLSDEGSRLAVARRDGSGTRSLGPASLTATNPAWSPNGSTIAFRGTTPGDETSVYLIEADGSGLRPITSPRSPAEGNEFVPQWSSDGSRIAYAAGVTQRNDVWIAAADGTALRNITNSTEFDESWPAWSPDARNIAFVRWGPTTVEPQVVVADAMDGRVLKTTSESRHEGFDPNASTPIWSPDGAWISGLIQGSNDAVDNQFVVVDAVGTAPPLTMTGTKVGNGSWQRLAP
jgi:Tol biopolymer transport system component